MITQSLLKELYNYDAEAGWLYRKEHNRRVHPSERKALYQNICINKVKIKEHRAVWIWHNGAIPNGMLIDHINGDSNDNRIENLRLSTPAQNRMNVNTAPISRSGYRGVHKRKKTGKVGASIFINKKTLFLGYFDTEQEAAKAYDDAATAHWGEFATTNRSLGLI